MIIDGIDIESERKSKEYIFYFGEREVVARRCNDECVYIATRDSGKYGNGFGRHIDLLVAKMILRRKPYSIPAETN